MTDVPTNLGAARPTRFRRLSRETCVVLAIILVVIVGARLALPWVLKHEINHRLSRIPGYSGHVDDITVQVWHGGYRMYHLSIEKAGGKVKEPFIAAQRLQFSIAYRELLHGRFVSDIEAQEAALNFVNGPTAASSELEADKRWQDVISDLFPISITHLKLENSTLRFVDTTTSPKVNIAIEHIDLEADGLQNRPNKGGGPYPAQIKVSGQTVGGGEFRATVQAEPLALKPHFKVKLSLEKLSLPALNDFLMAYANVDVGAGNLDVYVEAEGADGSFHGYVKPIMRDITFSNTTDSDKNAWQRIWKEIVTATATLIKNKRQNQLATLVPFEGKFSSGSSIDFWHTLGNLLHNGFIKALREGVEGSPSAKKEISTASK